jgi:hypothetical protein
MGFWVPNDLQETGHSGHSLTRSNPLEMLSRLQTLASITISTTGMLFYLLIVPVICFGRVRTG